MYAWVFLLDLLLLRTFLSLNNLCNEFLLRFLSFIICSLINIQQKSTVEKLWQ